MMSMNSDKVEIATVGCAEAENMEKIMMQQKYLVHRLVRERRGCCSMLLLPYLVSSRTTIESSQMVAHINHAKKMQIL